MQPEATLRGIVELDEIISLFQPDESRLQKAKDRQAAVWNNRQADYLPMIFGVGVPEQERFKHLQFTMIDEFNHPDVTLCKGIWGLIATARSGSDGVPSIRPNLGTGFVATMFGLEQTVMPDAMPWLKEHLAKEQIEQFTVPDDVSQLGCMPAAITCLRYFVKKLGPGFTFLADTQSPFDIAHLVRGNDIFTDIYDDPAFVHHLLELTTQMYIKASMLMKQVSGEALNSGNHGGVWMANGGVRACEDSSTLLSPASVDEFVIPYLQRALEPFGGGWVHYCGNNDRLLHALINDTPAARGINFGNPERHDPAEVLPMLLDAGKFYVGGWDRRAGEDDRAFLGRILAPLEGERRGLILQGGLDTATPQKAAAAMDLWHQLQ